MPRLILASSSPRRRQLLSDAGFRFDVLPARDDAESGVAPGMAAEAIVAELARRKAEDVLDQVRSDLGDQAVVILGADTVAECDGAILGKPRDHEHARQTLQTLSGRRHRVLTGVYLLAHGPKASPPAQVVGVSRLRMDALTDAWLEEYIESGAWRGKAGAFGFQDDLAIVHLEQGSAANVVGLPMELVIELLAERGCFAPDSDAFQA